MWLFDTRGLDYRLTVYFILFTLWNNLSAVRHALDWGECVPSGASGDQVDKAMYSIA